MSKESKSKQSRDDKEQKIKDDFQKEVDKIKAEDQQVFLLTEMVKELKILNSNF